ncbi:hypothetical protein CFP56_001344 [Quercus suber]|uniref:PGG domain-containing protein n=1 Tax=Quercus suber TaxID=58331 RepID=A0AAW0LH72_QUESU
MRLEDDDMIELHKTPGSRCRDDTLMEITIQGGDDIVDRYNTLAKTTQSRKKWWKNLLKHLNYEEENCGYIMVMAAVITTITFQQAASPPGGVWPQSGNVTNKKIHPCMGRGHSQTQLLRILRLSHCCF